jgi:hypothetical protein
VPLRGKKYNYRDHRGSQRNTNKVLNASPCPSVVKNITTEITEVHREIQIKSSVPLRALCGEKYNH